MPRNLSHIAGMAFNQPLLLEPAYARVFFCALGQEIGASRLVDAVSGTIISREAMGETMSLFGDGRESATARSYEVKDRIAVIPVSGTLVSKMAAVRPYSGMTGYNGIVSRVMQAIADPGVDGLLLDMDTPGGMVAGAFDAADLIARMRSEKPIWSLANDMSCSAGQLLSSACSHRLVTQTARTGSIGVLMAHSNYSGMLEQEGIDITLIFSGSHKVDGNPYNKLPEDVRVSFQEKIDGQRKRFAGKVATYTGMSVKAVLATEAAVYDGQEAVKAGLANEVVINADALGVMREHLDKQKNHVIIGEVMATTTTTTTATAGDAAATGTTAAAVTAGTSATTTTPAADVATASASSVAAAVQSENQRIMGILNCEEAKGREATARALAGTENMSVESAQSILATVPLSAQARTETGFDALLDDTPAAVSGATGAQASAAEDDGWDDIPV
ncbi:capsid assembly protein [Cedecea neteri]|uniref:Capsid assembly protein n=2 Tax=Enterobacteriaceae TaxID=543 RepID=A0A089PYZ9_9ENTR|nr:capsid assembly protein [Cedecea neteri]